MCTNMTFKINTENMFKGTLSLIYAYHQYIIVSVQKLGLVKYIGGLLVRLPPSTSEIAGSNLGPEKLVDGSGES